MTSLRIALSAGEPAGIGPELLALLADRGAGGRQLVYIGDPAVVEAGARAVRRSVQILLFDPSYTGPMPAKSLYYVPLSLQAENEFGFLRLANAPYVLNVLSRAAAGCISGEFDAMVTAPLQKSIINDAGIAFSGHTEFLQQIAGIQSVVMLLAAPQLRVALATTHLPLRAVADALSADRLRRVLLTLEAGMRDQFGLTRQRIAVLGLNPHAGEGGHLGREEIEVMIPVLDELRASGMDLLGPWPADTAFVADRRSQVDVYLAMYHDQGLPVLKTQAFGEAVNVTLGLPFIRTSVDHGTALDIAGKALARPESLFAAVDLAFELAANRRRTPQ